MAKGRTGLSTWISRAIMAASLAGAIAFLVGFNRYADDTLKGPLGPPEVEAPAAVVLTGRSDARLRAGVALVERGQVERLLISGVYQAATAREVQLVAGGSDALFACCVELGREAGNTIGNAQEVRDFVARHDIRRLVLVTETYHMPRALLEVRQAVPGVQIIPYGIRQPPYDVDDAWSNERVFRGLLLEYTKYLLVHVRVLLRLPEALMSERSPA
jgi:uncharacterized SAM-binding protein YcdF (DUF218 family)